MDRPKFSHIALLLVLAAAFTAHALSRFFDGYTVAKTQQQLSQAMAKHPDRFLQFSSNPVYQPLFSSYSREVDLLRKIVKVTEKGDSEEMKSLVSRAKLNTNPLFKSLLKAKDKKAQTEAARELFSKLSRPSIDQTTISYYETGKTIMSELGFKLPELKSS